MTPLLALAPTLLAATTSKAKTTSSSSVTFLIFIVIVVGALYFLFLRPNQQKARKAREENSTIGVGDKVVSIGGIVGTIQEMHGDRVVLLSANPGVDGSDVQPTRLVLLRSAISRKIDPGTIGTTDDLADEGSEHREHTENEPEGDGKE